MPLCRLANIAAAQGCALSAAATHTRRGARSLVVLLLVAALAACQQAGPRPDPHYVVGEGYHSGGAWWYPRETYDFNETGLAAVYPDAHPALTTDGEVFRQDAIAVAQATVQLPSVARLTDLQTGRFVLVRINDRGAPSPTRLVQVTRRVARLLGMPDDGVAQVRLTLLSGPSQAAAQRVAGAPLLVIAAAPRTAVAAVDLAPPPGMRQEAAHTVADAVPAAPAAPDPVDHVSGNVTQGPPRPGRLWVRLDTFESYQYAAIEQAKLAGLSPRIQPVFEAKNERFRVMVGPLPGVAAADAAVMAAVRAGVNDARIVVE